MCISPLLCQIPLHCILCTVPVWEQLGRSTLRWPRHTQAQSRRAAVFDPLCLLHFIFTLHPWADANHQPWHSTWPCMQNAVRNFSFLYSAILLVTYVRRFNFLQIYFYIFNSFVLSWWYIPSSCVLPMSIIIPQVVKIVAFAGTGKTTTLLQFCKQRPHLKYVMSLLLSLQCIVVSA